MAVSGGNSPATSPKGLVRACDSVLDAIAMVFGVICAVILAVMVGLNLYNVLSRSFLGVAYGWIFNWTMLLFVWMLLLGLFVYIRLRHDVVVDIVMTRLPRPVRKLGGLLVCVIGMLTMAAILRGAPELLKLQSKPMEAIALPIYVRSGPLFISSILVFAHFALDFLRILTGQGEAFARNDTVEGAPE
ncbi:TRAP transporter small permease subunit [Thioclava sp. GXIMD2076]|uniref:TRAP transporter small permease protein n=1 Tax=Thioclava kandeliae TaxID=3070818 RepID=A0ABV1SHM4_9RHOB